MDNFVRPATMILLMLYIYVYLVMANHHFQVVDLACGYGFTVFAVKDKSGPSCYGTGLNTDSQIGKQVWNLSMFIMLQQQNVSISLFGSCECYQDNFSTVFSSFFHSLQTTLLNPPASKHTVLYTSQVKRFLLTFAQYLCLRYFLVSLLQPFRWRACPYSLPVSLACCLCFAAVSEWVQAGE